MEWMRRTFQRVLGLACQLTTPAFSLLAHARASGAVCPFGKCLDPRVLAPLDLPEPGPLQGTARRVGHAPQILAFHGGCLTRPGPPYAEVAKGADLGEQRKRSRGPDGRGGCLQAGQVHRSAVPDCARSRRVGIDRPLR